jgi:hypothetical protein
MIHELSTGIHRGDVVARHQLQYFVANARTMEKSEATDDERIGSFLDDGREGSLQVEIANLRYDNLPSQRTPRSKDLFLSGLEVKNRVRSIWPNVSGMLTTGGGLVFTGYADGSVVAYDDTTLAELWKINVGSGINAPPMTFEAAGKQYVAILSGLSRVSRGRLVLTPELREMRHQTTLFVFGP